MSLFTRGLLLACLGSLCAMPLQAATQHGKSAQKTTQKAAAKAPAKSASGTSKRSAAPKAKSAVRPAAAPADKTATANCRTVKVKTAKGYVNRRSCKQAAAPAEPKSLTSPITENALTRTPPASPEVVKARTVPDRAYAVDGQTFFYQGRKYRVAGLKGNDNSDMAKQRLQRSLESGTLNVSPLRTDESGVATATVRVNGRDIVDDMP